MYNAFRLFAVLSLSVILSGTFNSRATAFEDDKPAADAAEKD